MKGALAIIAAGLVCGCAVKEKPPASMPEYTGVSRRAEEIAGSLKQAWSDGKSVRELHHMSMGVLDRLDYKATKLLGEDWGL
jgi:hypothetical protein